MQSPTDTVGRALRISKTLFLTNAHVVQGKSNLYLVKQDKRGELDEQDGLFEVLHISAVKDLALLKIRKVRPSNKPYVHLYNQIPKVGSKVSEFLLLKGEVTEHTGYHHKFGGRDIYEANKSIPYVGSMILPPNSALYEKKGLVYLFDQVQIDTLTKELPSKAENEMLTTIPIYQGESGSPVFYEPRPGVFYMCGVSTKALNMGEMLSTPGHPLGFSAYARTVSFMVHRDAIQKFIEFYTKSLLSK